MKMLAALVVAALLTGCATTPHLDLCKSAAQRRVVYQTAITAADALAFSGQRVPQAVTIGRQAAVTALAVLDANCPEPK